MQMLRTGNSQFMEFMERWWQLRLYNPRNNNSGRGIVTRREVCDQAVDNQRNYFIKS